MSQPINPSNVQVAQNSYMRMPMDFGIKQIEEIQKFNTSQNPDPDPDPATIDYSLYNEHHLRNILIGLNSPDPERPKLLLKYFLEFRKTKPDDYVPPFSKYVMPTHDEILIMMSQKITPPRIDYTARKPY